MKKIIEILKSGKGIIPLVVLFLAGVFLVFFSDQTDNSQVPVDYSVNEAFDFNEYEKALEAKISEQVNKISGVSQCEAAVILERSYVYEYVRLDNGDVLVCENDGYEIPVVECLVAPEIKGISVICSGGNDPQIKKQITDMLIALLDVPSNKIWVGGKE